MLPYGDVDAIVGVDSPHDMNRLAKFLALDVGASHGGKYKGNGRQRSILSDEYYQVNFRFANLKLRDHTYVT